METVLKNEEIREIGLLADRVRARRATTAEVLQLVALLEKTETGRHQIEELALEYGYESGKAMKVALQEKLIEEILSALVLVAVGVLIGIGLAGLAGLK